MKRQSEERHLIFRKGDFSPYGLEIGCWDTLKAVGFVLFRGSDDEEVCVIVRPDKRKPVL